MSAEADISAAMATQKRRWFLRRLPNILGLILLTALIRYGWRSNSTMTRWIAAAFVVAFFIDTIQVAWKELKDPALVDYSRGTLHFHWISGRSMEVGVSSVRRVRIHENTYWQFRRVYPKWYEIELEGEPRRVLVDEPNLTPSARGLLSRMSHSRGSRSAVE